MFFCVCVGRGGLQRGTDFALMHLERMDQFALGIVVYECVLWRRQQPSRAPSSYCSCCSSSCSHLNLFCAPKLCSQSRSYCALVALAGLIFSVDFVQRVCLLLLH